MVLITVSPWLIRNHSVFGAYTLAHTGGINLLDGNNPYNDTGGGSFDDKVNALLGDLQTVPLQHMFDGKEVERDTRARSIALDYDHNQVGCLRCAEKSGALQNDSEGIAYSMGPVVSMMPSPEGVERRPLRKLAADEAPKNTLVRLSQLYYYFLIVLFAISLPIVLKLPIRPQHIGLAIIVSLTLFYLVLFGNPRYHFSMMPWVAIYSGLGAQALLLGRSSLRIAESGEVRNRSVSGPWRLTW
jgi:hypothetical protein